jgi:hypothetical protein
MQWCYFLRDGCIAGVRMLPSGLSDEDKIARAPVLFSKRKGPFDGFEIWDCARRQVGGDDGAQHPSCVADGYATIERVLRDLR